MSPEVFGVLDFGEKKFHLSGHASYGLSISQASNILNSVGCGTQVPLFYPSSLRQLLLSGCVRIPVCLGWGVYLTVTVSGSQQRHVLREPMASVPCQPPPPLLPTTGPIYYTVQSIPDNFPIPQFWSL